MFGLLGARYSQKHLLAMIYLLRTLFIIAFLAAPISAASTLVFAAAMGFLWLGVAPLVSGIIGRVFASRTSTPSTAWSSSATRSAVLRRLDGRPRVRPHRQLQLRLGALIVIGVTAFTLQC